MDVKKVRENADDILSALDLMDGRNADISRRVVKGETYSSVARDYGISPSQIRVVTAVCIRNALKRRNALSTPITDDAKIEVFAGNGLSARSVNALRARKVETIADLKKALENPRELLRAYNFGRKSLDEVLTFLGMDPFRGFGVERGRGIKSIYDDWERGEITAADAMREIGKYNGWA